MPWAKFCCDITSNWITTKWNFHRIVVEYYLWNGSQKSSEPFWKVKQYQCVIGRWHLKNQSSRGRRHCFTFCGQRYAKWWPSSAKQRWHYSDVIVSAIESQITSITVVNSTVYSGADQRKHQSSASLAFVEGIHRSPVNSPHKGPVTRKMFPFDDVIMKNYAYSLGHSTHQWPLFLKHWQPLPWIP